MRVKIQNTKTNETKMVNTKSLRSYPMWGSAVLPDAHFSPLVGEKWEIKEFFCLTEKRWKKFFPTMHGFTRGVGETHTRVGQIDEYHRVSPANPEILKSFSWDVPPSFFD